jgi:LCP family protein required for cell wall assembly
VLHRVAPAGYRSAFAAAFLSFLFPGLGQAYAGLTRRALAFAAPAFAGLVLVAVLVSTPSGRMQFLVSLVSPTVLLVVLGLNIVLLFYRALAVVDAYRAAESVSDPMLSPTNGWFSPSSLRAASLAGLIAVLLVLAGGHMALARYNLLAYDLVTGITSASSGGTTGYASGPAPSPSRSAGASSEPGSSPVPTPTEGPSPTPAPTQTVAPHWNGTDRLNVLLIGTDSRPDADPNIALTDTLIVASVDPVSHSVAMFSVPRDTINVPLPAAWPAHGYYGGSFPAKINGLWATAQGYPRLFPGDDAHRGYTAIKGALSELLQLDVRYFVEVDFDGFRTVVDTLGGVTVDVQAPVSDDHYPTDDGRGALNLYIPAGIQHMDGAQALAYARARNKTNDFDRAQRQQRLIKALRDQVDLPSLLQPGRLEALVVALKQAIHTDVPPELLPRLVTLAQEIDLGAARSVVFTPPEFGVECLECYHIRPNITAIRAAVRLALVPDPAASASRERLVEEAAVVWVVDGGDAPEAASAAATYLSSTGMTATMPPAGSAPAAELGSGATVVTVYNGAEWRLPETIALLERAFGVTLLKASDPSVEADIVVTTGPDTPRFQR